MSQDDKFKEWIYKYTYAPYIVFLTVTILIFIWGQFFMEPADAMIYSILGLYFFIPAAGAYCSWILGHHRGVLKWFAPFAFTAVNWILPYLIFHSTGLLFGVVTFIPSAVGFLFGIVCSIRDKRQKKGALYHAPFCI